jgi:hypothetical protein
MPRIAEAESLEDYLDGDSAERERGSDCEAASSALMRATAACNTASKASPKETVAV